MTKKCERCGGETICHTMSYFNTQHICMGCDEIERAHPDFKRAQEAERQQVVVGNRNFAGVGMPDNLIKQSIDARKRRENMP